ncbi:MAG: molecular chaperone HtpG [Spirochaetia bacterium]|nr:molecular chaperone HtpG [Spirochaetia bacterium]
MNAKSETLNFQAETKQLLDLMIHSIYSSKDIFLRELISNASDALDKLRFEAVTKKDLLKEGEELHIRLEVDKKNKLLTIHDNGIGMNRNEVIENIGTIAKSGTRELLEKMKSSKQKGELEGLIGQFGVGFYSSFMAADKVSILTKRAGEDKAVLWLSSGEGSYEISESEKELHGTSITLHLKTDKEDESLEDYTDEYILKRIVKQYSDFISYPILIKEEREEEEKDEKGEPKKDGKKRKVIEDVTINSMKPIWTRSKSDVTEKDYAEFYKHISHDWNEPLKTITFSAEGRIEYKALLYIPAKSAFDMFFQNTKGGLRLYVKKVMILENLEELIPRYLRFIKGVVESTDLPLNISRENLQKNAVVMQIQKGLTKKILDSLNEMLTKERDNYEKFWAEFSPALKEGINADFENREKIASLLLFYSSNSDKLTTLKDYVSRMKSDQTDIFFITGENRDIIENSPHLESFKNKGYEVLYLLDPVDEFVLESLGEFDKKKIKNAGKGADISTKEEKEKAEKKLKEEGKKYDDLLKFFQEKLSDDVKEVKLSSRLVSAPACLVADEHGFSPHLEKILKQHGDKLPKTKKILEINSDHKIFQNIHDRYTKDKNDPLVLESAELLYNYSLLAEGAPVTNPVKFTALLTKLMERAF